MCGICGIINFDNTSVSKDKIQTMMEVQIHRGPNDSGKFFFQNVGLGFVRLSILDLSQAGHQPMHDVSKRYTIIFNGEIYNYLELRGELEKQGVLFHTQTDTEVLLQMYLRYGEQALDRLNGMFAFAIYDKEEQSLFAARDRFGVKPFYYFQNEEQFIFASEIPPILAVYGQENQANEQQVFDYLAFNRTDQTEDTFFKNIKKLQHGHFIHTQKGNVNIKRWYDVREHVSREKTDPEKYKTLLTDAVRLRLRSDVPVGVCLSGGLDSSAITSLIAQKLSKPEINTFSAVYTAGTKADESEFIDLYKPVLDNMYSVTPTAEMLLKDLQHFIQIHAEPIPSTSPYAQYSLMRLACQKVTVTLDGQGADEALGGYHYFFGFYFKALFYSFRWIKLLKEITAYTRVHRSFYGLKTFFFFLLPKKLKTQARVNQKGYISRDFVQKMTQRNNSVIINDLYASENIQTACVNHFERKMEHLLKWNDRNSMAFSVESRTPFLDYRLVEYTLSLPSDAIIKNGYTKSILRESMKSILPEKIRLRRDKVGFATPQDEWFRTPEFQKLIFEILNSASFPERNIIDARQANVLYQKHLSGEINIASDIWKWINLELWFQTFIDK